MYCALLIYSSFLNGCVIIQTPCLKAYCSISCTNSFVCIFILLFSFNWNWVVAGWNESFPLYVAHITKYTFAVCVNIFLRGVYLPIKKLLFRLGDVPSLICCLFTCRYCWILQNTRIFLHLFICSPFLGTYTRLFVNVIQ